MMSPGIISVFQGVKSPVRSRNSCLSPVHPLCVWSWPWEMREQVPGGGGRLEAQERAAQSLNLCSSPFPNPILFSGHPPAPQCPSCWGSEQPGMGGVASAAPARWDSHCPGPVAMGVLVQDASGLLGHLPGHLSSSDPDPELSLCDLCPLQLSAALGPSVPALVCVYFNYAVVSALKNIE